MAILSFALASAILFLRMETVALVVSTVSLLTAVIFLFLAAKKQNRNGEVPYKGREKIEKSIKEVRNKLAEQEKAIVKLNEKLKGIIEQMPKNIQKIKFRHYEAYKDTGGKMSFVLVLLDGENNGVIINSMHGRDITRLYGKIIKNGIPETTLSTEEKQTLEEALTCV